MTIELTKKEMEYITYLLTEALEESQEPSGMLIDNLKEKFNGLA